MILVTLSSSRGRLHCILDSGIVTAESDSKTVIGALTKTYVKLITRSFKIRIYKWRETWTER